MSPWRWPLAAEDPTGHVDSNFSVVYNKNTSFTIQEHYAPHGVTGVFRKCPGIERLPKGCAIGIAPLDKHNQPELETGLCRSPLASLAAPCWVYLRSLGRVHAVSSFSECFSIHLPVMPSKLQST